MIYVDVIGTLIECGVGREVPPHDNRKLLHRGDGSEDGGLVSLNTVQSTAQALLELVELDDAGADLIHDPVIDVADAVGDHLGEAGKLLAVVRGAVEHDARRRNAAGSADVEQEDGLAVFTLLVLENECVGVALLESLEFLSGEAGDDGAGATCDNDLCHSLISFLFLGFSL